jgi:hypothetical protein
VIPGSIVVDFPRRWKRPRRCRVRTDVGDFAVTVIPQPDRRVRLDGKNVAALAAALKLD